MLDQAFVTCDSEKKIHNVLEGKSITIGGSPTPNRDRYKPIHKGGQPVCVSKMVESVLGRDFFYRGPEINCRLHVCTPQRLGIADSVSYQYFIEQVREFGLETRSKYYGNIAFKIWETFPTLDTGDENIIIAMNPIILPGDSLHTLILRGKAELPEIDSRPMEYDTLISPSDMFVCWRTF